MGEAIAKHMNFTDTLSNEFLYKWVGELFHKNVYVFHGVIDSAQTQWDTLIAGADTSIAIPDVVYPIAKGQKISKATFTTRFSVLERYKGEIPAGHLTFKQVELYPELKWATSTENLNPYSSLLGSKFLFFGNRLDQVPESGPIPNHLCRQISGFFVDSLNRVRKWGRIQTEFDGAKKTRLSTGLNTGVPGLSIPFDSLFWAFTSSVNSNLSPAQRGVKGASYLGTRNRNVIQLDRWMIKVNGRFLCQ